MRNLRTLCDSRPSSVISKCLFSLIYNTLYVRNVPNTALVHFVCSYEATSSRKNRSLVKELITGAVASVFLVSLQLHFSFRFHIKVHWNRISWYLTFIGIAGFRILVLAAFFWCLCLIFRQQTHEILLSYDMFTWRLILFCNFSCSQNVSFCLRKSEQLSYKSSGNLDEMRVFWRCCLISLFKFEIKSVTGWFCW